MVRSGPTSRAQASGGMIEIELPETPSTGYRWELENADTAVAVAESRFDQPRSETGRVGGAGARHFRLRMIQKPPFTISFVLRRQWEAAPIERRTVEISGE